MYRKPSLFVLCSLLLLLSACVSKSKYLQLEADHADAKHKLKYTETRRGYTEESREKCIDSLADCQGRFKEKEDEKVQLSQEMGELQVSLEESQSTIEKQTKVIRDLHATRIKIERSLKEQIEDQEIKLEEIEGKLKVTLVDKLLFDAGKVEIAKRGKEVLLELADTLRENKDQNIVIEGHTDDVPIGLVLIEKYPTNWELSTARAVGVVRFLQEKGWLEPERLSATGYSYYKPVASNDTAEGRSQNRRIEMILVPKR